MPSSSSSAANNEAYPESTDHQSYSYYSSLTYYLISSLPPTWDTVQKGLALFAVIVILRSCFRRLFAWSHSLQDHLASNITKPAAVSSSPSSSSSSSSTFTKSQHQGQDQKPTSRLVHNHPPPPPPQNRIEKFVYGGQTYTINHFRPYLDSQRYPGGPIPPWVKRPPTFGMEKGYPLMNPSAPEGIKMEQVGSDEDGDSPDTMQPPTASEQYWNSMGNGGPHPHLLARPPPAPPLTPPELSNSIYHLQGGQPSHTHESFIHQPNPDYASASSSTPSHNSRPGTSAQARHFTYTKTIPIGVPIPRPQPSAPMHEGDEDARIARQGSDVSDLAFSPSSYPPTSPLLPPAPPTVPHPLGPHAESPGRGGRREVDVQGRVVSVMDDDGAGWQRHTRVYGGGECLACKRTGQEHGSGGYYGATVSPEEMR